MRDIRLEFCHFCVIVFENQLYSFDVLMTSRVNKTTKSLALLSCYINMYDVVMN